jgi:hypothetical protein
MHLCINGCSEAIILHSIISYIRVASLSKSITPRVSLYLLFGTRPWALVRRPLTALNSFDLEMTKPKQIRLVNEHRA